MFERRHSRFSFLLFHSWDREVSSYGQQPAILLFSIERREITLLPSSFSLSVVGSPPQNINIRYNNSLVSDELRNEPHISIQPPVVDFPLPHELTVNFRLHFYPRLEELSYTFSQPVELIVVFSDS